MDGLADRMELGPRIVDISMRPLFLARDAGPLRLVGAWTLTSDDPRFGGISALAIDGETLLAITDAGAVVHFGRPGSQHAKTVIRDVPAGPGDPRFKSSRDAESLVRDPSGRGWWVGFENRHSLWLFDAQFRRPLARVELGRRRVPRNGGVEGLVAVDGSLFAFPESGERVLHLRGNQAIRSAAIDGVRGRISDAAALPDGRLAVIQRQAGATGFRNALGVLRRVSADFAYAEVARLPLGPFDNVEALAAEPLPSGGARLWMMTDNNYHAPLRTLLIAYDLPPERRAP